MQHVSDKQYRCPGMGSLIRYATLFTGWRRLCLLTALLCGVATPAAADTHESGVTPAPVLGDLNGDGRDDVLLRHENGRWFYYPMDGRYHITDQRGYADLTRNLAWQFAGIGDLNGDGRDDVLVRHTDGRWFYYPMDGRYHITGERGLAGLTRNLDWHVAGIGDLNGDGKDDVLLRNKNGRWYYYPMNGRRFLADERGYADLTRDLDWQVAGIGDLNGDGKDDVLLRHTDGRWDYYPMDGRNPVADQRGLAGLTRNLAWHVAGIGDLNGDGRDDVLLRHTDSRWYYYPMDGRRFLTDERGYAGLTRNLAWQVAGIGDLNGDGRDDVLLRHTDSRWYYYPMDGRRFLTDARGYANLTRNPDWSIAALSTGFAPADQSGDIYVPFPSGEGEFSIDDTGGLTWRLGGFTQRIGNAGCIRGDFTFNGVFHDLGTSKWQMRAGPTAAWSDVQGTIETDSVCGYDLTAASGRQYRAVLEITIGGDRRMYSSNIITKNTDQGNPDLVVESPSVSDSAPITGQSFTFGVTVRNQGGGQAVATTLRYYRSTDATISTGDTEVGTDAVSGLAASGSSSELINLTAPSSAGTYYYGACVESVSGESDTGNNCSSGVSVTVSSPPGFAPADQSAFDALVVGKRIVGNDPAYYTEFVSAGRFREVEDRETYTGRYTYENTGPNAATVEFRYDDGDRCTSTITFDSATAGTLTYSCNDGERGTSSWRIVENPAIENDDHGDTRAGASPLALNASTSGRIEHGSDVDYFSVQVSGSRTLTVYTTGNLDTTGELQSSSGSFLASNDDGGSGTNFRIEREVSSGNYYIKVGSYGSNTGSYTLHAEFSSSGGGGGGGGGSLGQCSVGLVVNPGESCTHPVNGEIFSVDSSGRGHFMFATAGTGISISANNVTFAASRNSDDSWTIERLG